jgi:hypothetical protein
MRCISAGSPGTRARASRRPSAALQFEIPELEAQEPWRRCIDTYRDPPEDFCGGADAQSVPDSTYLVHPRSVVILLAKGGTEAAR